MIIKINDKAPDVLSSMSHWKKDDFGFSQHNVQAPKNNLVKVCN